LSELVLRHEVLLDGRLWLTLRARN
jgi:hypothetical protein